MKGRLTPQWVSGLGFRGLAFLGSRGLGFLGFWGLGFRVQSLGFKDIRGGHMSPPALTSMCAERSGRLYEGYNLTSNPEPA